MTPTALLHCSTHILNASSPHDFYIAKEKERNIWFAW